MIVESSYLLTIVGLSLNARLLTFVFLGIVILFKEPQSLNADDPISLNLLFSLIKTSDNAVSP